MIEDKRKSDTMRSIFDDNTDDILKQSYLNAREMIIKKMRGEEVPEKDVETLRINYRDEMNKNSIFSAEKELDAIAKKVHPKLTLKNKSEKRCLRYLGKLFVEELLEYSVEAKTNMGKQSLDAESIVEGWRRYCNVNKINKSSQNMLFL